MSLSNTFTAVLMATVLLVSCSSVAQPTESGQSTAPVAITLTTNPNPPVVGDVTIQFKVVDEQGRPVSGADFDVIADHIDMSGMTLHGKAADQGDGLYAITANFSMSGNWKLTVQVRKDDLDFKQDLDLEIQ